MCGLTLYSVATFLPPNSLKKELISKTNAMHVQIIHLINY